MAKKLNKPAQAARDAFIQRKVDEAVEPWARIVAYEQLLSGSLKSDLSAVEARLDAEKKAHRSTYLRAVGVAFAAGIFGIFLGILVAYHTTMTVRYPAFITPPINTPIVAYTENGWHQAYVDISGNIRSMENGQRIMNATSWMKP